MTTTTSKPQPYDGYTSKKLMELYEAKYGTQGGYIFDLSRSELVDGLTNPAHIPMRIRRYKRS